MPAAIPIFIGLAAAGTVVTAIAHHKAGTEAARVGEANAQIDEFNAKVAEAQAADAIARGTEDEQRFRSGVRTLIGSQRAGFAGQNVDVGTGSAVDVQADAAFLGELDALTIRTNAAREAWGHRQDAENQRLQAAESRRQGQYAKSASHLNVAATVISGASQVGGLLSQRYGWGRPATP